MIIDTIDNLGKYTSLNPLFADVIEFLKNNDLAVSCLEKAGIDIMKRAEVLTLPELLHLSDVIEDSK